MTSLCVSGLIHMWYDVFTWHVTFEKVYLIDAYDSCVTWIIHVCDLTHSFVWHDLFICVTWLIHVYDMTHSYVWHGDVGGGGRDPRNQKDFVPLSKEDKGEKSHELWSVAALPVQGSRITYRVIQFDGRGVTVIYCYKSNRKMGSTLKKSRMGVDS